MNYKAILGISLAAVFAVSMMMVPSFANTHGFAVEKAVAEKDGGNYDLAFVLDGEPPAAFWGVAIPTSKGFVGVTEHEPIPDSAGQPGLHTHFVTAAPDAAECPDGVKITFASFEEVGEPELIGNAIIVEDVPSSVGALNTDGAFSFALSLSTSGNAVCINP